MTVALIRSAIERLRVNSEHIVELRALDLPGRYGAGGVAAGWFDDPDMLAREAARLDLRGAQVYVTLNPANPALLARAYNRIIERPKATTSDHDILRRVWLPLDIDPVRPAGVSADPDELAAARQRALDVAAWLHQQLNDDPAIWAFSGNGFHLLFRIELSNDDAATQMVKGIIETASDRFSDQVVRVDKTVFNAARIWRLYGTLNRKGDNVPRLGRVHRRAAILGKGFE
ncbi:MAG: hypothetical protein U1D55_00250 [Phycisphaerae bacterium]